MKECSKCHQVKCLSEFHKDSRKPNGHRSDCKKCFNESKREYDCKYRQKNAEYYRAYNRKHYQKNPEYYAARNANRRARKLSATPPWLTEYAEQVTKDLYAYAKHLKETTGRDWHVDHIHPLKGRKVCGLHHPNNLQVIPAFTNLRKNNGFRIGRVKHGYPYCLRIQ